MKGVVLGIESSTDKRLDIELQSLMRPLLSADSSRREETYEDRSRIQDMDKED